MLLYFKSTGTAPPWNLKFLLIRGGLFSMTIFDDYLFLKSYKGVPLIFFSFKIQKSKIKEKSSIF